MIPFIANGLFWWLSGKDSVCKCRRHGLNLWVGKIPWRKKCQPTSVFLSGKSHGQRSLAGYSPWGHKKSQIGLSKLLFIANICAILKKKKKSRTVRKKIKPEVNRDRKWRIWLTTKEAYGNFEGNGTILYCDIMVGIQLCACVKSYRTVHHK